MWWERCAMTIALGALGGSLASLLSCGNDDLVVGGAFLTPVPTVVGGTATPTETPAPV